MCKVQWKGDEWVQEEVSPRKAIYRGLHKRITISEE